MDERTLHPGDTPTITITFATKDKTPISPAIVLLNIRRGDGQECSILQGVRYTKTAWNPNSNKLKDGHGNTGEARTVAAGGTADFGHGPITFQSGDVVFYNGERWRRACRPASQLAIVKTEPGTYSAEITLDARGWWHFNAEGGMPYTVASHSILI